MRNKALIYTLVFLAAAAVPLCFAEGISPTRTAISATADEVYKSSTENEEVIISIASEYAREDFCDEALKALLILAKNNADLTQYSDSVGSEGLKSRLHKLINEADATLTYNGDKVFIPVAELSSGVTKASDKHSYLCPVASPWDCFDENFVYGKEYSSGISAGGINYLCENGLSYKEALSWYLPEFEIK